MVHPGFCQFITGPQTTILTHISGQLRVINSPTSGFGRRVEVGDPGGNPTQTPLEHAKLSQKSPQWDLHPGPSCCHVYFAVKFEKCKHSLSTTCFRKLVLVYNGAQFVIYIFLFSCEELKHGSGRFTQTHFMVVMSR